MYNKAQVSRMLSRKAKDLRQFGVFFPSGDDIYNTRQQGIPGVVLSDRAYSLINVNLAPERHSISGMTSDIIKGYLSDSLFRFIK